jgi:hypothetical protein
MNNKDKKIAQTSTQKRTVPVSSSSQVSIPRKSIDPSAEIAEPHILLDENSFPRCSIIAKDDDSKRIDALIESIHAETFKKEEEQPHHSSFQSSNEKSISVVPTTDTQLPLDEVNHSLSSEQHFRRTVTFDDDKISSQSASDRLTHTSHVNFQPSNYDPPPDEPVNTLHSSDTVTEMSITKEALDILVSIVIY